MFNLDFANGFPKYSGADAELLIDKFELDLSLVARSANPVVPTRKLMDEFNLYLSLVARFGVHSAPQLKQGTVSSHEDRIRFDSDG